MGAIHPRNTGARLQDLGLAGRSAIARLVRSAALLAPRLLRPPSLTWHHHACDRQRAQRASLEYLQYLVNSGLFSPGRLSQASARVPAVRLLAARAAVDGAPPKMPCSQVPLEKKVDDLLGLFVEYQIEQSRRDCRHSRSSVDHLS